MALASIKSQSDLKTDINSLINQLGGWNKFIQSGDRVLLKPNFNTADHFPASSDYKFLEAVVKLIYEQGAQEVILGDSCTFSQKTEKVINNLHIRNLENLNPAPKIYNFDRHNRIKKPVNGQYLKHVSLPEILGQVDKLILLPCLKTHFLAQFTGSLKLSIGFMDKLDKIKFHAGHLQEKIAELNTVIHPDLVIMDARKCFINGGPMSGEVKEPGLLLASTNRLEIDKKGIEIIKQYPGNSLQSIEPDELMQINYAKTLKIN